MQGLTLEELAEPVQEENARAGTTLKPQWVPHCGILFSMLDVGVHDQYRRAHTSRAA